MKLQLYLNDLLFNEMHLPKDVFDRVDNHSLTPREETEYRKNVIDHMAADLKGIFWPQICKARKWEIVFVVESKIHEVQEEEVYYLKKLA